MMYNQVQFVVHTYGPVRSIVRLKGIMTFVRYVEAVQYTLCMYGTMVQK